MNVEGAEKMPIRCGALPAYSRNMFMQLDYIMA
jgi:hypothetical protein